ncbi:cobalt-precorrin-5B C(1)-methyltransferase [Rubrobacter xylanophilus]|uniref:Cobalt-precorrin-5B C(1)-methyltransferase n=1 Tax=Rubrobacter xylanophilus TaxID=49319 RepID=A0A510HMA5_9ACTN|nr:cobalt-precorrin-5B (C(1))-methyltransferase [Rubrobacter xylanophilus]BBL81136.1 cobalt-precorrin-5B C(1)-methyltransferase [Rubrobacter xylanophilus]
MAPERKRLREPSMPPSMARVRGGKLRTGWTTGTCAAAAAKAAARALVTGEVQERVEVRLPKKGEERRVGFEVERCELGEGWAEAVVVKDAGDDPDVTHGAHLTARVSWREEPGVELDRGEGVGVVTKPGLGLPVGAPAINPVPRRMILYSLREALDPEERGVRVVISVPGGEEMARKTTNPRLGIVGGISILGTTGIVRPFSTAAWAASVIQAIDVMAAQGGDTFVLSTGGLTERAAMRLLPQLEEVCFIEVGDFTGRAVRHAAGRGLRRGFFVGMAGKLAKLASGVMMTHWTRSRVDTELLARITREAGGDARLAGEVRRANSARHAYELWREAGLSGAPDLLCARVAENLREHAGGTLEMHAIMVDFDTLEPVGSSPGALELTAWRG